MAKTKELTVESLTEIINAQGLEAAKAAVNESKSILEIEAKHIETQIAELEKRLEDIRQRLSTFDTLLIGALKKVAGMMGISLGAAGAGAKKGGGGRRLSTEERAALRTSILSRVKNAGGQGAKMSDIIQAVADGGLHVGQQSITKYVRDLVDEKSLVKTGEKRNTVYHAA